MKPFDFDFLLNEYDHEQLMSPDKDKDYSVVIKAVKEL